jgi:hypothetical protein
MHRNTAKAVPGTVRRPHGAIIALSVALVVFGTLLLALNYVGVLCPPPANCTHECTTGPLEACLVPAFGTILVAGGAAVALASLVSVNWKDRQQSTA